MCGVSILLFLSALLAALFGSGVTPDQPGWLSTFWFLFAVVLAILGLLALFNTGERKNES